MKRLRKFLSLTPSDRRLLVSAALLLGTVRLGFWLVPFQTLRQLLDKIPQTTEELRKVDQTYVEKVAWAVTVVSCYIPGVRCFERAIAVHLLLSHRGYPTSLCIGLAKSREGHLQGHAWVESQEKIVIGNLPDISHYSKLPPVATVDSLLGFCLAFQMMTS